jgi:ABC-type multidrug transport system ATPase subunit
VLVMTHSHALDLELVDAALSADRFGYVGLIGSATKRARFLKRLKDSGLSGDALSHLVCPIGLAGIASKAPAAIAASVAADLLIRHEAASLSKRTGRGHGREGLGCDVAGDEPAMTKYLLEAHNIVKVFGNLAANDDVSLMVAPGEIHALLGENGAGKSTLVKIIYGSLQPNSGELRWLGRPVHIDNPAAARKLGIGMVFQHFSLFEALTVAENISLALPGAFDLAKLSKRITAVSAEYGLPLNPSEVVLDLSVGQRQRIEIVRCLLQEPRLLIMDEPTAVLTPQEADQLFLTLDRLAGEGCAILYISHRLEEVKRLCHTATILRLGKVVATVDPAEETAASLARLMVGSDVHEVRAGAARPVVSRCWRWRGSILPPRARSAWP